MIHRIPLSGQDEQLLPNKLFFSGYHYNKDEAFYAQSSSLRLETSFPWGKCKIKGLHNYPLSKL